MSVTWLIKIHNLNSCLILFIRYKTKKITVAVFWRKLLHTMTLSHFWSLSRECGCNALPTMTSVMRVASPVLDTLLAFSGRAECSKCSLAFDEFIYDSYWHRWRARTRSDASFGLDLDEFTEQYPLLGRLKLREGSGLFFSLFLCLSRNNCPKFGLML